MYKDGCSSDELPETPPYDYSEESRLRNQTHTQFPVIEICCGTGDFLCSYALSEPQSSFIGIDWAMPVIERAAKKAYSAHINNLLFYCGAAEDFLEYDFKHLLFSRILINFPDPWPKKRHLKRRLPSAELTVLLAEKLVPEGLIVAATDLEWLHEWHMINFNSCRALIPFPGSTRERPFDAYQGRSSYEIKGLNRNRLIYFAVFKKRNRSSVF